MTIPTTVVSTLPTNPDFGANFSFARLTREKVTYANHGLHKYPAKFIPQLPRWALEYDDETPARVVLDPFCGSGTTLVEVGLKGGKAIGVDISPLACIISRAKCAIMQLDEHSIDDLLARIVVHARKNQPSIAKILSGSVGKTCLGMHFTWANWFDSQRLSGLLALRDAINEIHPNEPTRQFSLAVLSAITKSCSSLSEDQIKVRFDPDKNLADPYEAFSIAFKRGALSQRELSTQYLRAGAEFEIQTGSATELPFASASIDRVITSPPYINAIDYTMAHKYNMFVLGALMPEMFKDHCREYIGVTERAVRSIDMQQIPDCSDPTARAVVDLLVAQGTSTSRNRAYVVAQYFSEMTKAMQEGHRVLIDDGLYFLVVGETNRICGVTIRTGEILEQIANSVGFETERNFFHVMANRSSMRLNRSQTGGSISREQVYAFRKR
jgi:tRNA G10  N-methylase Trm11